MTDVSFNIMLYRFELNITEKWGTLLNPSLKANNYMMKDTWYHRVHTPMRELPYSPKVASELYKIII